ncbi:MAG: class I SAM-dependent methyltransferase [Candidatus Bathyarchaeota archaeon]|nr:class I SAM-dependent methyltransferase [Candidatus Bathyarchaeota archaeon]
MPRKLQGCQKVLDAGVGARRLAKPLQETGVKVIGVDIARLMLEKASQKAVGHLVRGDACFLPFKDGVFDASVCVHLLHLIPEWKQTLSEICRVTEKIMLSIAYTTKNPVRQSYSQLLKGCGREQQRLGRGELELKDLVKPWKSVFAASYENNADELLEHLSMKAYSSQWDVPDEMNEKVVAKLRARFGGKAFPARIQVVIWNIEDLKASTQQIR